MLVLRVRCQEAKYSCLPRAFFFIPIALETLGAIAPGSLDFLTEVGRRLIVATGDARETAFLFQRISVTLQRVQCGTNYEHRRVFCRTRRRAGPLAIPTCFLASVFSSLAFYTIGQ